MSWIKLEDKLPKHLEKVLIFGERWVTAEIAFFNEEHLQFIPSIKKVIGNNWEIEPYKVGHGVDSVSFWMPLPEPPKENE